MSRGESGPEVCGRDEDIAIVGMACLFPRAESVAAFWQNLTGAVDCIGDPPPGWHADRHANGTEPLSTVRGGFLGEVARFDYARYGVMPSGIDGGEPDQFLALRCAFEALEDAEIPRRPLDRDATAVILGRGLHHNRGSFNWILHGFVIDQVLDLLRKLEPDRSPDELTALGQELKRNLLPFTSETAPGLAPCVLAGRIANRLDLKGPVYTIDAACASVLFALEHGVRLLRSGACSAALVGGVHASAPVTLHQWFCRLGALSPTGAIAPFSENANGILLGEGCGMLLLKRRRDAERDGHRIYALVKAVGVSADGRGAGLLAPRTEGQQLAIRRAYEQAGLAPSTVGLIEGHGTGMGVGDRTEIESLIRCFGAGSPGEPATVALGSVKSMIGHLLPASGAPALIKTALALYHRKIPPTLRADATNRSPGLAGSRFYLVSSTRPWFHAGPEPRRAGVDAFGFGGINAHAILEEYPAVDEVSLPRLDGGWPWELVVLSATDRWELRNRAQGMAAWLSRGEGLRLLDVAASCAVGDGPERLAVVASDVGDLIRKLERGAELLAQENRTQIQDRAGIFWYHAPLARTGRLAFVFPGEGAQYPGMLAELCCHFPEARREFDRSDAALARLGAAPLSRSVYPLPEELEGAEDRLLGLEQAVVSVQTASRALLAVLKRLGIRPQAIVGHSSGEIAALFASGSFAPVDEQELVESIAEGVANAARVASSGLVPDAVLVSVGGADRGAVERAVSDSGGRVTIAMDNCPNQLVLSGDEPAMARVLESLRGKGGLCERLPWGRGYHTEGFLAASRITEEYYRTLRLGPPQVELWSCATAGRFPSEAEAVHNLAILQWRRPVRFRETVNAMHEAGVRIFLEVGPRGNLSAFIDNTLGKKPHAAVPLDTPRRGSIQQLCQSLAMLAAHGVAMDLSALYRARAPRILDLTSASPPAPLPPAPHLSQELPELKVSDEGARRWQAARRSFVVVPAQEPKPAALDHAPVVGAREVPRPLAPNSGAETEPSAIEPPALPAEMPVLIAAAGLEPRPLAQRIARPPTDSSLSPPSQQEEINGADLTATVSGVDPRFPTFQRLAESQSEDRSGATSAGRRRLNHVLSDQQRTLRRFLALQEKAAWKLLSRHRPQRGGLNSDAAWSHGQPSRRKPPESTPPPSSVAHRALLGAIRQRTADSLVAEAELDVRRHRFLRDHTFFGRHLSDHDPNLLALPVMPLAMTLELIAEAALELRPDMEIMALTDVEAQGWLAFESSIRRVRVQAQEHTWGIIDVTVWEDDREEGGIPLARAKVELGKTSPSLGPARLEDLADGPFPWPNGRLGRSQAEVYERIIFNGPGFQGIASIDAVGTQGVRATVVEPDPQLLGLNAPPILPVGLIDSCGQIAVFSLVRDAWTPEAIAATFPNRLGRVEFASRRDRKARLQAVARVKRDGSQFLSDVEMVADSGEVVLRVTGRIEEIVWLPADLYASWSDPYQPILTRDLTHLFEDVPGASAIAVREVGHCASKLMVHRLWSGVLARMILSAEERRLFEELRMPPVPTASWLLGRVAAKDAARVWASCSCCMADVVIVSDEAGRPWVRFPTGPGPLISLAHKGFETAVAVAADPSRFFGVGIDVEPLRSLPLSLMEDAFSAAERETLEEAANRSGEPSASWLLAGWGAKEAVGKALGRGVVGGPRSLEIRSVDTSTGQLKVSLRGPMATLFPSHTSEIDTYRRTMENRVVTLCLLPTTSGNAQRELAR